MWMLVDAFGFVQRFESDECMMSELLNAVERDWVSLIRVDVNKEGTIKARAVQVKAVREWFQIMLNSKIAEVSISD